MTISIDENKEWLVADGCGGFATGTALGVRTRRYHALLCADQYVLVNGAEVTVKSAAGVFPLSIQRYLPDVLAPDARPFMTTFCAAPSPTWTFQLPGERATTVEQSILGIPGTKAFILLFRLLAGGPCTVEVRPLMSGRNYHALHRENGAFRFAPTENGKSLRWTPYEGVPPIEARTSGTYRHEPVWYRNFLYSEEHARGLDAVEDLAAPGVFMINLESINAEGGVIFSSGLDDSRTTWKTLLGRAERALSPAPAEMAGRLAQAAEAFFVHTENRSSLLAGYPWFSEWGRDTFISLRGLALGTSRYDEAGRILSDWAGAIDSGMLPNRFPGQGAAPEFNSVDASLWFVIAAYDYLEKLASVGKKANPARKKMLCSAIEEVLVHYSQGTRFGIRADGDGLLAAGEPGVQLTWMDSKIGDEVVTPRIGKPVEVQALWLNALAVGGRLLARPEKWVKLLERGQASFERKFWNEELECLYDVVDVNHEMGQCDGSIRPNQIYAIGGLPWSLLQGPRARAVLERVRKDLLTPMGLRSLAPSDPQYRGRYEGDPGLRDRAYHQGTVWPYLMGPFIDAFFHVYGDSPATTAQAEAMLAPLLAHLGEAGLGHVSEITDGDAPHIARGCPFQAWSLGELIFAVRRLHSHEGPLRLTTTALLPGVVPRPPARPRKRA